jgi:ribonuclease BN (tRNA processing enzyme)
MRPLFHPSLVNGRYGDPVVYVETLFEKRGLLFDLGEIASLSSRKVQRIDRIFVSHAHIDHFVGFDHLLRLLVGREKTVCIFGPSGLADHVYHKLQGYRWDLVEGYRDDLVFVVSELKTLQSIVTTRFRLNDGIRRGAAGVEYHIRWRPLRRTDVSRLSGDSRASRSLPRLCVAGSGPCQHLEESTVRARAACRSMVTFAQERHYCGLHG